MIRPATLSLILMAVPVFSQTPGTNCFVDPFDGKQYPNLQSYVPTGSSKTGENDTTVYLLTNQDLIGERVTVEGLVSFIKSAKQHVIDATKANKADFLLLMRFDLNPKSYGVKIFTSKPVDKAMLQSIQDSLDSLKPPAVTGQVLFCVQYSIGA